MHKPLKKPGAGRKRRLINRLIRNDNVEYQSYYQAKKLRQPEPLMADATTAPAATTTDPNPNANLWSRWAKTRDWQDKLEKAVSYKAFDVSESDDMKSKTSNSTNNVSGIGFKEILALGLLGAGGMYAINKGATPPPAAPPAAVAQPATPATPPTYPGPPDSNYQVLFYDKDGNPISVPRLPAELRK